MVNNETVIAERRIELVPDPVHVRISSHDTEGFWRVEVESPVAARQVSTTTVDGEDSFLWPLIRDAVAGHAPAWAHLAHWGRAAMTGRGAGLRATG